jgi:hypothetical protein
MQTSLGQLSQNFSQAKKLSIFLSIKVKTELHLHCSNYVVYQIISVAKSLSSSPPPSAFWRWKLLSINQGSKKLLINISFKTA